MNMYMYMYFMKKISNDKTLVISIVFQFTFLMFYLVEYFEFRNIQYIIS